MKKALAVIVILAIAAAIGWKFIPRSSTAKTNNAPAPESQTYTVARGDISVVVETTGRVVPNQEVEIKCKASGEITSLPVDISDKVKKGDLLIQLDPEDEQRSVQAAEVDLAVSKAKLEQAQLNLKIAESNLVTERLRANASLASAIAKEKETAAKLDRVKQLQQKQMASAEEVESAETSHAEAVYSLESARATIEELKTEEHSIELKKQDVLIAEAQVQSDALSLTDAQTRLKETTVSSPIDGVVATRDVQEGQIIASAISNVGGGTAVMTLVDLSRTFTLASVDESDIGWIEPGQSATITTDAFPDIKFPGKVVRVATQGEEESNVVTFEVKIEILGPEHQKLKPEMTTNIEINAVSRQQVLVVPASAVTQKRGDKIVMLEKPESTPEATVIKAGVSDGEYIEVLDGLTEGQIIKLGKAGDASKWNKSGRQGPRAPGMMGMMRGRR